ncbi:hypothetical protein KJ562_00940 [Patescibacteria group bacterium]|nr:hypothetical protein [Patescibacteria group bacterium]MBU4161998.1 hypothetical protein [Patescibacteria group bacterium]
MMKNIFKKNFFKTRVVLINILVASIISISIAKVLLSADIAVRITNILILVAYALIGVLLIVHSLAEERRKEVLGKMVKQRTRAIIESKKSLIERVEEIARSKIVLQERTRDLEMWRNLVAGRELKMAELKQMFESLQSGKK